MSKKNRRSFLKYSFFALAASIFGTVGKAIGRQVPPTVRTRVAQITQRFGKLPKTAAPIDQSPTLHVSTVHLKRGNIRSGEAEMKRGLREFQGEAGISKVAIYKLVSGSTGAPSHIFAFIGKKPGATRGLANKPKYRTIQTNLSRMTSKPIKNIGTNAKFIGKIG